MHQHAHLVLRFVLHVRLVCVATVAAALLANAPETPRHPPASVFRLVSRRAWGKGVHHGPSMDSMWVRAQ